MSYQIFNNISPLIEPVYNFKYNYIRINGGDFNSQTLYRNFWSNTAFSENEHKQRLYTYLSRFLFYQQELGIQIKFDCAMEADSLYTNLEELRAVKILDWILEWQYVNNLNHDSIKFLTNDMNCKFNTPQKYIHLVEPFVKYRFFSAPCLDFNNLHEREFDKKFYFPLARQNGDRNELHKYFKDNNLLEESFWSFNAQGLFSTDTQPGGFIKEEYAKDAIYPLERYYEEWPELMSWDHHFVGIRLMKKSFCSIILETYFQNENNPEKFITEKVFRAFSNCHPFIVCGKKNSLNQLQDWGFKTFDKWWPERYDEMGDELRMKEIKNLIDYLSKLSDDELIDIYHDMIPTLLHNFNHVKNIDLEHKEFQNNTRFTIAEGYEYPLDMYDIQYGIDSKKQWNTIY